MTFCSSFAFSNNAEQKLKKHVNFLSSDNLAGRRTGSPGEQLATQYVANLFWELGLKPAGSKNSFFQTFSFIAGKTLGKDNSLSLHYKNKTLSLALKKDWIPLSFSKNLTFKNTSLVFAGYGISAPQFKKFTYDSYKNLDVKNKWILVLNQLPPGLSKEQRKYLHSFSSLRYKTFTAKEHGAQGIVFINSGSIPLNPSENSINNAGIAAVLINKFALPSIEFSNQSIQLNGQIQLIDRIQKGHNVLGRIKIKPDAKHSILIGAHIDHLGQTEQGEIYPGADDNASGVAAILTIASQLTELKNKGLLNGDKDIIIAAWSGEELGLLGSSHFINQLKKNKKLTSQLDAVINLDMIGHLEKSLIIQSIGSSKNWTEHLVETNKKHHLTLLLQNDPYLPTDSTSFYLAGIPTLNFFTGAKPQYHTTQDKAATLNYAGINSISRFIVDLVLILEQKSSVLSYNKINNEHYKNNQHLNVYLGTIPDYSHNGRQGVRILGVKADSPAQKAGIKAHDIIIELNHCEIHDIYDYTFALNKLPIGKPASILILRHLQKKTLTVIGEYKH